MPAHSLTLAGMGTFVLWFGWFAFNGCSTIVADSDTMVTASNVFLSSNIAAAASTVTVLFITWIKYKKTKRFHDVKRTFGRSGSYYSWLRPN